MEELANNKSDTQKRHELLKQLLREGAASTQEELCEALGQKKFDVTQSTVSRDLRRIGAIKTTNAENEIVYKMPESSREFLPRMSHDLNGLVVDIQSNENIIVLHTTPGSASLVATHLDSMRQNMGILGTIAGDDAIFVVPASVKKIPSIVKKIKEKF